MPVIIAVIQWSVTTILHIDRLYFKYENINKVYITVKVGYLMSLEKLKEEIQNIKEDFKSFFFI